LPLATTLPLSVSMNLTTPGTLYMCNHTVFVLCDWFISGNMSLEFIHVIACVRISFLFKAEYYSFVWTYHIFVYSLICWWTLWWLLPLGHYEWGYCECKCTNVSVISYFKFFGSMFRKGIAGSYGNSIFNF
jgi:hypothetical protein